MSDIDLDKFDFGFTAVDEDELEVVQKQSQKLDEFLNILPLESVIKYLRFLLIGLKFLQILYKALSAVFLKTLKSTCLLDMVKP